MKNTTIKNVLFILSGIMIAASASIFAAQNTTTLEANLVNLRQYLKELYITSTGTPAGDNFLHIDGQQGTILATSGGFAFDFNSHTIIPSDYVGVLHNDGQDTFANGIVRDEEGAMSLLFGIKENGEQVGISVRDEGGEIQAMLEYESTGNQDMEVQIQHQLKVKADGTTVSFDDYNVLGYNTILGLGSYGLNISSSSGGSIFSLTRDGLLSLVNYTFPLVDGLASQVLATDGAGQLYWTDIGDGGGFSLGVTSINGATGAVFLTTDDIEEGNNNQFIYTKRFQLSSAQVLDLHNTPIQVIDAPGAGKMVTIVDVFGRIQPGETPYTLNSFPNVSLYYQDQPVGNGYKTNFDFLANITEFVQAMSPGCFGNCASDMNNKPLFIGMEPGGSVTDGDGSVDVYVSYKILDLEMTAE